MTETKDRIEGIITKQVYGLICECGGGGLDGVVTCKKCEGTGIHDWRFNTAISDIEALIAESNRESYKKGVIDAINAIVLDEKDLPKGFEKVKSVQMKKAKEFLKDL